MKAVFSLVLLSCVVAVLSASHQESEERNVARAARAADPVADRALQKARRRKQAKKARKSGKKGKKAIRRGKGKRPGKKSGKKARKSGKKGKKSGKKARKSGKKGKKSGKKAKKSGKKGKKSGKKAKKSGKKGKKSGKKGKKAKKAKKAKKSGKKARKSGKKGKKSGKKATKTMKQGGRPKGAIRSGQASGRVLKGNGCEYVSLTDIKTKGTSCTNGYKFVLKGATNTRRQFLIVNDLVILAFVTANTKFPECTSFKDVTADVTCKAVTGLDSTDLSASGTATTASSVAVTTGSSVGSGNSATSILNIQVNLTHRAHASYGYVTLTSDTEFSLTELYYDGAGPKTNWIVGTSSDIEVDANTYIIDKLEADGQPSYAASDLSSSVPSLPAYSGESLTLRLPVVNGKQLTMTDIKWVALYCRQVKMLFMDARIPTDFQSARRQRRDAIEKVLKESQEFK